MSGESADEEQRSEELEVIRAIARTRKTDDLAALCAEMQLIAAKASSSDRVAIYLVNENRTFLEMATAPHGYEGALAETYRRAPFDGPIMGDVIRTLKPLTFSASSLPDVYRAHSIAAGFVEYAIVPLHSDGDLTGTLNLARTREHPYDDGTVRLAVTLGDQISVQIERARLLVAEKERAQKLTALNEDLRRSYEELERAQTELVAQEARASLGDLAVLVAHEVRNPLGVIFNVATQLKKLVPDAEQSSATELVGILQEEANRLERIVRAFLDFGRPVSPTFKPVEVASLVEASIELTTRALPASNTTWEVDVDPNADDLECDEHLFRQALVSALTNAAEAQSFAGHVRVTVRRRETTDGARLVLVIEDEGEAIDLKIVDRVFHPFFTTKASGTGLGLAIVKRNVDMHAGEVVIAPRKPRGTVLTIEVPTRRRPSRGGPAAV
ncbi:MAG TPA: ATP-binding protein [Polyangiaceae bacterium]